MCMGGHCKLGRERPESGLKRGGLECDFLCACVCTIMIRVRA